ncbi:MAG: nucleotidyl transferase AbiEii/AbiGii toxin family protein [Parachlamydiales bacterium]
MLTLRKRLEQEARKSRSRLDVVQQDYLLTWLLQAISHSPELSEHLVFKGGTALKKCYFGEYRFSEDLDFTATPSAPRRHDLLQAIEQVCHEVERGIGQYGPIQVVMERYREREPHSADQEAFTVRAQFPWQHRPLTRVMIEVSFSETLVLPPIHRPLLNSYEDGLVGPIMTYSLDEIVLEKLRAVLQQTKKLHERSWSRSRARDYYDLWQILCRLGYTPSVAEWHSLLEAKCASKEVGFSGTESFFAPVMVADVRRTWEQWVGPLVADLPPVDQVIDELTLAIDSLFAVSHA